MFPGKEAAARRLFAARAQILDSAYERRLERFLKELVWMSKVLRRRENVALG